MQVNAGGKQMLQGSFNLHKKDSDKEEQSNVIKKEDGNNYDKTIEGLEEQMKSIRDNDTDDDETKKQKIKAIQEKIKEIRRLKQEEELKKLKNEDKNKNKVSEEQVYQKNADGDKLTLSDEMQEILKGERKIKNQEEKKQLRTELAAEKDILEKQIEKDRERNKSASRALISEASIEEDLSGGKLPEGVTQYDLDKMDYISFDAKHKDKDVEKLEEAIERIDNNEVEKLDKTEEEKSKSVTEILPTIDEKEKAEDVTTEEEKTTAETEVIQ